MRPAKAWVVAAKDFKIFAKKRSILYSLIGFEILVSVVLPFVLAYAIHRLPARQPVTDLLPLINAFSFWFVIGPAILPVSVASYSLVGEKVQQSLEPLLATPVSDAEILAGKAIAALLPALAATYAGALAFMVLVDAFTHARLGYRYYPNWNMGVTLLLLAPLASILSVAANVLISSRSSDVRTAQQLGAVPMVPLFAVYLFAELGILTLSSTTLLLLGTALLVVDVATCVAAVRTFRREEILTGWR